MAVQTLIQVRQGTTAQWSAANPALSPGEFGYDIDTKLLKIGTGGTVWSDLVAIGADASQLTTGTTAVARGGTGVNTFSSGGVLYSLGGTTPISTLSYSATPTTSNNLVLTGTNGLITAGTGGFSTSGPISSGSITGSSITVGSGSVTAQTINLNQGSTPAINIKAGSASFSTTLQATSSLAAANTVNLPTGNGTLALTASPTFTGTVYLPTGTATAAPLDFNSGILLSTPVSGAVEYDGKVFYGTNATGRGYIPTEHFISSNTIHTLAGSATITQPLFYSDNAGVGGTTGATLPVQGGTTYFFECMLYLTGMSTTSGNLLFDLLNSLPSSTTAGTASIGSIAYFTTGYDVTTVTTGGAAGASFNTTAKSAGSISTANTGTSYAALISGTVRVSTSGLIVPSIQLVNAATTPIVQPNTWFRIRAIGTDTVNYVGPWSV